MALPQLSEEQRAANLKKAAEARHARAELREKIKNGQVTLEYVLDSDDPAATPYARPRPHRVAAWLR